MLVIRHLIILIVVAAPIALMADGAQAGRRGGFAHYSHAKVWHGNRIGSWSHKGRWGRWGHNGHWGRWGHRGHWPRQVGHWPDGKWHAWGPRWNSGWGWSRVNGYPHRWWSWNSRRHPHFASRRHARHAINHWGHGSQHSRWNNEPRRQGVWYAAPGFGSTAARGGPVRQGEWHAE